MRRISRSPSYLIRTPYSYCFRLNVPIDLQKFVGKTELRYTLATGYVGLAKSKARLLAGQVQEFFRRLREIIKLGELTDEQITDIVNRYFRNFINGLEKIRVEPGAIGEGHLFRKVNQINQSVYNQAKTALAECDYTYAWPFTTSLLKKEGLEIKKVSTTHNKLCREILIGLIKYGEIEERRNQGDYSDDVEAAFPLPSDLKPDQTVSVTPVEKPSVPLNDVIEEYKRRQLQSGKWRPGTLRNHKPKIRTIKQVLGNRPVNQIPEGDVRKLAKLLELLPPGFARLKDYEDISNLLPKDLEGKHKKTLDSSTRRDYLNLAKSVFAYAKECGYIEKNPVLSGFIPPKKKNTRGRKLPFDDPGDLEKIFNPKVYLNACKDKPSRFWVPLLALYTGCRLEEMCQLYTEDVKEIEGIWCLHIKGLTSAAMDNDEDDDQMLKTGSASRVVPLHPFIVDELKFPAYVKRLKNKRDRRVFPELKKVNFKYGHEVSKWFSRWIRTKKVGIIHPKKSFHSFRHNVADLLYKQMVPPSLIEELEGRAGKTETERTYVTGHHAKNLYKECILKLEYQVDLKPLKKCRFVPS